jgi:hypothetical protein
MATFTASGGVRFTDTDGGVTFVAGYQTVGGGGGGGATTLNGLDDVVITAAASGDILRHNGTNWVDAVGTTHFDAAGTAASAVAALSTVYQPLDSDLTAIAALSTTSYGRAFLALADAAAGRTALGLGTAAVAATGDFEAAGAVSAHTGDTTAAHAASAISVGTLNGNLAAVTGTDVEQVIQAVDNLTLGGTVDVVSNVATSTILGRITAGSGNSEELTPAQTRTLLGVAAATPVGASTWNSVQNYSTPGVMWDALANAFALTANTIRYTPFRIPDGTTLAVDRIWFEVTTLQAGSNARVGVWAADINWQPTGAPLIDATTTTATTGAKNITVSATLPAGRYIAGIVSDANISCRAGIARVSWGSDHSGTAVAAGGSSQMITNRRVTLTYPGTMPTPGPAWTATDTSATNTAGDLLILLRGTFS